MTERRTDLPSWFASKVGEPTASGCWPWIAGMADSHRLKNYGVVWVPFGAQGGGRVTRAHRVAWVLVNGPIPRGINVLHRCDNPPCVNPSHLFLGTQDDNMKDSARKGRQKATRVRGERHGNAVLTQSEVSFLRSCDGLNPPLAAALGVSLSTIRRARSGLTYA